MRSSWVLPDSTYGYTPFEYVGKEFYPTRADSAYAYDSVIYTLSTFEIDPVQSLKLPIYLLAGIDSIELFTNLDSVYLQELIQTVPDSLSFKENVAYVPTKYTFNYPYLMIGLLVFIILLVVVYLVFGKTIRKKFKLHRLKKEYERFSQKLENGISQIRNDEGNQTLIENILVIWKQYMEKLEDRPFTKYTSKEIVKAGYGSELKDILKNIDVAIYGNMNSDEMHTNFESLEDYTLERYQLKVKEVQNG